VRRASVAGLEAGAPFDFRRGSLFLDKFFKYRQNRSFKLSRGPQMFALENLAEIVARRAEANADISYTRSLLDKGVARCAKKFGEEATEAVIAAVAEDDKALRGEAADVLYHLLVLLQARRVPLADVMAELERRTMQSGLQEKAARLK
jgi:phosphoribosyl-ATP pyrophosphohydrolase